MIGVAASGSAVGYLNICEQQHIVVVFKNVTEGTEIHKETAMKKQKEHDKSKSKRVRKIYFDNEKHDIEETNTETFMCRSMSATNAYTKL